MKPLPHHYRVSAEAQEDVGGVLTRSEGLPELDIDPPADFGGPGDKWSPETLLVAAVVDCFILTFRAIARASRLEWISIACAGEGTVDRADGVTRFTGIRLSADLKLPLGGDMDKARRLLEKAEQTCLIRNSLSTPVHLEPAVEIIPDAS